MFIIVFALYFMTVFPVPNLHAIDSEQTRQTLLTVKGIHVVVEDPQPNIQKYVQRFGLTKEQLQKSIEQRLMKAGIAILDQEKWLKTTGRPMLYVNINTHEYQKYWYAYTIIVDLRQIVTLEANPDVRTLASTWSVNMAGIANIGSLDTINKNVNVLIDRFIEARQPLLLKTK
ncbi:MAG: hypothetical protein C0399_12890 [Syntrophus sp. (in: bacteria)]|nr:hypothetical protein [Syntrophus sp. (in: bacteria)]